MSGINASSMYLCQTWMHVLPNFPITEVFWYGLVHRNPTDSSNASYFVTTQVGPEALLIFPQNT